jgi:hypothetical protein
VITMISSTQYKLTDGLAIATIGDTDLLSPKIVLQNANMAYHSLTLTLPHLANPLVASINTSGVLHLTGNPVEYYFYTATPGMVIIGIDIPTLHALPQLSAVYRIMVQIAMTINGLVPLMQWPLSTLKQIHPEWASTDYTTAYDADNNVIASVSDTTVYSLTLWDQYSFKDGSYRKLLTLRPIQLYQPNKEVQVPELLIKTGFMGVISYWASTTLVFPIRIVMPLYFEDTTLPDLSSGVYDINNAMTAFN